MGAAIFLIGLAAASLDASSDARRIFQEVCTAGEGRFAQGVATPIEPRHLSLPVRESYGRVVDKAYRLDLASGPAYLLTGDTHSPDDPRNSRTCVVTTQAMRFVDAVDAVHPGGIQPPSALRRFANSTTFETTVPEGYVVGAYRLSDDWVAMKSLLPGKGTREANRIEKMKNKPAANYRLRD